MPIRDVWSGEFQEVVLPHFRRLRSGDFSWEMTGDASWKGAKGLCVKVREIGVLIAHANQ